MVAGRARDDKQGAGNHPLVVPLGDLGVLAKPIMADYDLGMQFWEAGNIDAQLLAILRMKPESVSADETDRIVRADVLARLADWLNACVATQHPDK